MADNLTDLVEYTKERQGKALKEIVVANGEVAATVAPEELPALLSFLRDDANCQFRMLMDVTAVDYPSRTPRFEVVYNLLSLQLNQRIRIKVRVADGQPVPSVVHLYPAAGWFEREVWDMYGVLFAGNPDLRRILTDYGFDGHPQRKDFPLTGYVEMRYDETEKRVLYEPVQLTQAFRNFDYLSPWEGPEKLLPGDEKALEAK
jgi:NADH-quinone oxidoreductase subunit C